MATPRASSYAVASGAGVYAGIADPYPAWRGSMSATNTVYAIGGLPTAVSLTWPSGSLGASTPLYVGEPPELVHYGYGGSVLATDLGAHGTMIFGGTGEAVFAEQLTKFSLSNDAPAWSVFQNPGFCTSEAAAIAADADWYYSPTDAANILASTPLRVCPSGAGEATWYTTWDKGFPIAYKDWVQRRKQTGNALGNNRPHHFRYQMPRYVPASATGNGAGALVVTSYGTIYGPFAQAQRPAGTTDAEMFADVWGSGRRKHWLYWMNVNTGAWTKHATPLPDMAAPDTLLPPSCWDAANKRIYYFVSYGSDGGLLYVDWSAGAAGLSISSPVALARFGASYGASIRSNWVLCVPTSGPNAGKRLWFGRQINGGLALIDIDAAQLHVLAVSGLPDDSTTGSWFSYRASTNEVFITTKGSGGMTSYRFTVPTDYTNAANYSVSSSALAMASGVSLESGRENTLQFGERTIHLDSLGVILMTQYQGPALAYRPL